MSACDSSIRVLCVEVNPSAKGLDLNDHVGPDARAVLDLLVERGCPMSIELAEEDEIGDSVEAVYEAGVFRFYNLIANTNEAADHFKISNADVILAIDKSFLTGVRSESGTRWLVVRDLKWDAFDSSMILPFSQPNRRGESRTGVGLKRQVTEIVKNGHLPVSFGIEDVRRRLKELGWEEGKNYSASSLPSVLGRLEDERVIQLDKIGRMENRIWSVRGRRVAEVLAPSPKTVSNHLDEMVENISDILVSRIKERAKEKLGL